MGMTIEVQATTDAEWTAMQSEGAPSLHVSYTTAAVLFDLFGIRLGEDDYCGTINPDEILSREDGALAKADEMSLTWVLTDEGGEWLNVYSEHVAVLVQIAHVALNLRRPIGFG